jgi:putative ABC transport system substrate-binding protein
LPEAAAELVALKVDAIVTQGGPSAAGQASVTPSTPVVVVNTGDVVKPGSAASLARPGNVTGVNDLAAAVLSAKRLEILKELVPTMKRVAVLECKRAR